MHTDTHVNGVSRNVPSTIPVEQIEHTTVADIGLIFSVWFATIAGLTYELARVLKWGL